MTKKEIAEKLDKIYLSLSYARMTVCRACQEHVGIFNHPQIIHTRNLIMDLIGEIRTGKPKQGKVK